MPTNSRPTGTSVTPPSKLSRSSSQTIMPRLKVLIFALQDDLRKLLSFLANFLLGNVDFLPPQAMITTESHGRKLHLRGFYKN